MKAWPTLFSCLILSSCAQTSYLAPSSGPVAELTIPAKTPAAVGIMQDAKHCLKRAWLAGNSNTLYIKEAVTQTIAANQLVTLYFQGRSNGRHCDGVLSFKAEAKQHYNLKATYEAKGFMSSIGDDLGQCTYSLSRADTGQIVPVIARKYEKPYYAEKGCDDALAQEGGVMPTQEQVKVSIYYNKTTTSP
jgi:hypothetical protein